jgi:hypothetical protein
MAIKKFQSPQKKGYHIFWQALVKSFLKAYGIAHFLGN